MNTTPDTQPDILTEMAAALREALGANMLQKTSTVSSRCRELLLRYEALGAPRRTAAESLAAVAVLERMRAQTHETYSNVHRDSGSDTAEPFLAIVRVLDTAIAEIQSLPQFEGNPMAVLADASAEEAAQLLEAGRCARDVCQHCDQRMQTHSPAVDGPSATGKFVHAPMRGTRAMAAPCAASPIHLRLHEKSQPPSVALAAVSDPAPPPVDD